MKKRLRWTPPFAVFRCERCSAHFERRRGFKPRNAEGRFLCNACCRKRPRSDEAIANRFWPKVDRSGGERSCWLWLACINNTGYGTFHLGGRMALAHRVAYELTVGPIPDGLQLDHVQSRGCTHRHCVNPAHLEPVTHAENMRRRTNFDAQVRGADHHEGRKTHCKHGHPFDEVNTYRPRAGRRVCRACTADSQRRYRTRKLARLGAALKETS